MVLQPVRAIIIIVDEHWSESPLILKSQVKGPRRRDLEGALTVASILDGEVWCRISQRPEVVSKIIVEPSHPI